MDRKHKQVAISASIVIGCILILVTYFLVHAMTPSKEKADLNEYYHSVEGEVKLILQDHIYEQNGVMIDGVIYLDYETVVKQFNHRFYWDGNENILTYTTPTEVIRTEVSSNEYNINKSKNTVSYPIVKTNGTKVYIALEFVANYSDFEYTVYENPDRVVFTYQWGDYLFTSPKKTTQVRLEPSIKSPVLEQVDSESKLMLVDTDNVSEKGFTKVITQDGIIGFVKNSHLNESAYESLVSTYHAPEYTHISSDKTVNLVWHQVTNQEANNNISALLDGTKGVTTISPTWFSVSDNKGNISSLASTTYVERAHTKGIEVWALIDDFNTSVDLFEVLSKTSTREKLINTLVGEVIKYNIDGINIDFEKITANSAPHYIQFLRELSVKCRSNGIVLSIDNYIPAPYNMFYDRTEQGIIADYIIVMGYDEHHSTSTESGSVSSLGFFKKALMDTLDEVPANRVIMAMPFYTRIWMEKKNLTETVVTSEARSMDSAWNFMVENGVEPAWDSESGQYYGEFEKDGVVYKCWFEEEKSIEERLKVVSGQDVAGVAAWRLGFERSNVWNTIYKYVN